MYLLINKFVNKFVYLYLCLARLFCSIQCMLHYKLFLTADLLLFGWDSNTICLSASKINTLHLRFCYSLLFSCFSKENIYYSSFLTMSEMQLFLWTLTAKKIFLGFYIMQFNLNNFLSYSFILPTLIQNSAVKMILWPCHFDCHTSGCTVLFRMHSKICSIFA